MKRQAFFESDAVDHLVTMVLELAAEQSVLRERLFIMERAAESLGLRLTAAIESYQPNESEKAALAAMRVTAIDNLMRSVNSEQRPTRSRNLP